MSIFSSIARNPVCLLAVVVAACSADTQPPAPVAQSAEAPEAVPAPGPAELEKAAARVLAPSPLELDRAVRKAGLAESLGAMVPVRSYGMTSADANAVALRTGVILADTVFTGERATADDLAVRAIAVRDGLQRIGASEALVGQVDDMAERIRSGATTRADVLAEVDGVTSMMVPEQGWGPDDRTGPLLQAGVWLEGAHLVSGACLAKNDMVTANDLLRDRELVEYFLVYLRDKGTTHAPSPVVDEVEQALETIGQLTMKESLDAADVQKIHDLTGAIIRML